MTTAAAAASTKTTPPPAGGDARLAAYRNGVDENGDQRISQQFSETTQPLAPAAIESKPVGEQHAAPTEEAPEPKPFQDSARRAIFARARQARDAGGLSIEAIAQTLIGRGIENDDDPHALDDAGSDPAPRQQQQPAPQPAPRQTDGDRHYTLKVLKNEFGVTREELLRYADVDEATAASMPDIALVQLAQKQIAATAILDEAKALRTESRTVARGQAPDPDRQQQQTSADPGSTTDQTGLHTKSDRDLMEIFQLGDPEEALAAKEILDARATHRRNATNALETVGRDVSTAIEDFAKDEANADIVADPVRAGAHRAQLTLEVANDLKSLVTPEQFNRIATDPRLAMEAYKAARADGATVRDPARIFNDAAAAVRQAFGAKDTGGHDTRVQPAATSAASERDAMKRGLIRQPTRSDSPSSGAPAPRQERASASDIIRNRFGSRMNRG